jgi:phage-related baseplate assembly protein
MSTPIDLSQLPAPTIIENLDFESIFAERKARLVELVPADARAEMAETLELESEPLTKFLQESAFRELLLRQEHNERSRSLMLAYAAGPELDHIGVTYYLTERLVLDEGDPRATPPVSATYESDRDYRRRILLAHDAFSTAGSRESYIYHALGASSDIADVQAVRPIPGRVKVYVMSRDGSGVAEQSLLDVVAAALTDERVRPLSDTVEVASAEIIDFAVSARLQIAPGPDTSVVVAQAKAAVREYAEARHRIGEDIVRGALEARLYVPGVERVDMDLPAADIVTQVGEAPYCAGIEVTDG